MASPSSGDGPRRRSRVYYFVTGIGLTVLALLLGIGVIAVLVLASAIATRYPHGGDTECVYYFNGTGVPVLVEIQNHGEFFMTPAGVEEWCYRDPHDRDVIHVRVWSADGKVLLDREMLFGHIQNSRVELTADQAGSSTLR